VTTDIDVHKFAALRLAQEAAKRLT
jgi:hypothetical protein